MPLKISTYSKKYIVNISYGRILLKLLLWLYVNYYVNMSVMFFLMRRDEKFQMCKITMQSNSPIKRWEHIVWHETWRSTLTEVDVKQWALSAQSRGVSCLQAARWIKWHFWVSFVLKVTIKITICKLSISQLVGQLVLLCFENKVNFQLSALIRDKWCGIGKPKWWKVQK